MNDNPLVSVIVLNYNGASLLEECLASLNKISYSPVEIIVVDNNSSDNSLELLASHHNVTVIANSENYGYAEGNNIGISHCAGKYAATLNNDMTVEPSWLDEPVQILESNPQIGVISCRQMSYYNRETIDGLYHTIRTDLTFLPFGRNHLLQEKRQFLEAGYVISANGGSALLRKSMFSQLNGFDTRFFAYLDETDLCMKAFVHNWSCYYVPEAVVYHKGSVSFRKTGVMQYYFRERNRIWFLFKYFPLRLITVHLPFILLHELRVIRIMCLKLKSPGLYIKARLDALKYLSAYREERKENLQRMKERWVEFLALKKRKIIPRKSED